MRANSKGQHACSAVCLLDLRYGHHCTAALTAGERLPALKPKCMGFRVLGMQRHRQQSFQSLMILLAFLLLLLSLCHVEAQQQHVGLACWCRPGQQQSKQQHKGW